MSQDDPRLVELMKFDSLNRGMLLIVINSYESLIDNIIGIHFQEEKKSRESFKSLVLNEAGITLYNKIRLLVKILKIYHQDIWKNFEWINDDLEKMRDFRNTLAHSKLDISDEFLDKNETNVAQYINYKNGVINKIRFNDEDFKSKRKIQEALDLKT